MTMQTRSEYNWSDRCLIEVERALRTLFAEPSAERDNPAGALPDTALNEAQRRHLAGLMRINHVGEICAQALYSGQSLTTRDLSVRTHMLTAAQEETDHLAWCAQRLEELGDRPSVLNPLWYGGAFTIGAVAGALGDPLSLGFVVETERQVEAHLQDHLEQLAPEDERTRRILEQMQADEVRHAETARAAGGVALPPPLPWMMAIASRFMKAVAYRI